ncbi:MAG: hypothetical protein QNJ97_23950 [Myxococcota bacterium]|nr:hypothetical protein [Myxococcota bacterium]
MRGSAMLAVVLCSGLIPPVVAQPASDVTIDSIRIFLHRKGSHVEVEQIFTVRPRPGEDAPEITGYKIPLPADASSIHPIGEAQSNIQIGDHAVAVKGPIPEAGLMVSVRYHLPVKDDTLVFDQRLDTPIPAAQAISTWTLGKNVSLAGQGFTRATSMVLNNGLSALVISARDIEDGHLSIRLTGLAHPKTATLRLVALLLSVALLVIGIAVWLKQKIAP